jgi:DNA-binding LytR/AlgR family response regulator
MLLSISEYSEKINIIGFTSPLDLITGSDYFDVIFIDIQMPVMNGVELSKIIRNQGSGCLIVFCSGKAMPTPEMFKVSPYRFIIKDIEESKVKAELLEILREAERRAEEICFDAVTDGNIIRIKIDNILYISNYKRKVRLYLNDAGYKNIFFSNQSENKEIYTKEKIETVYENLKDYNFARPHKSYIVNMQHIVRCNGKIIKLSDGTELNISRSNQAEFNDIFAKYIGKNYRRNNDGR